MGCRTINVTQEEVRNARKDVNALLSQPLMNQTAEETVSKLRQLKASIRKVNEKYIIFGESIRKRVSEVAKRSKHYREESLTPDNKIQRGAGTFVHDILANLVDFHANKEGTLPAIRDKLISGDIKMNIKHFHSLNKLAEKIIKDINDIQNEIDPKGKATIITESFMADFLKDVGGTEDIVVVFSDNTGLIYDYKTSGREDPFGPDGKVVRNPLPYKNLDAYNASQAEYKRILEERIGIKFIRQNRVIPIALQFRKKPVAERTKDSRLLPEVQNLATVIDDAETLRAIPVGGEKSRWAGIDKLIAKQYKLIDDLSKQIRGKALTKDEKEHILNRIKKIEKSINTTLVDENIIDLITTISNLATEVATRLDIPINLPGGEANEAYLSFEEIGNFMAEMNVYGNIIAETDSYFNDMRESDPDKYKELVEKLDVLRGPFERVQVRLSEENQLRAAQAVSKDYWSDEKGHLIPLEELNFGQLKFLKISAINHPIYQAAWKVIEDAQYEAKKKILDLDKEVYEKESALFKWAEENMQGTDKRKQALDLMINYKTGNMYSRLKAGFASGLKDKIRDGGPNAIKIAQDNYEIRDKALWKKEYKLRLDSYKETRAASYGKTKKDQDAYQRDIDNWVKNNDLEHSSDAWVNDNNLRRYLSLKQSIKDNNMSDEYRKIKSIKPVFDFYELWNKKMEEFADVLGITDYSTLPPGFIPNIRKEMVQYLSADGINIPAMYREFMDSFSAREEDTYLNSFSEDGIEREAPILFLNKFFTQDGKLDNIRKSYDLGSSIMIFGKMTYNYEQMTRIEPVILGLKNLLGQPTPEQGGTMSTDRLGRKIKGKMGSFLTKKGEMTDTYKLFEDITDLYLYGVKFKNKTFIPGVDVIHTLTKMKNGNSVLKLGFAIVPAAGAWLAGQSSLVFIGKKGQAFTDNQLLNTYRLISTHGKKVQALSKYFDAQNDDYFERELQKHKSSTKNKILNDRTAFAPLRNADTSITTVVLTSMAQNWGVNKDGTIVRFAKSGKEKGLYKDIKSIFDSMKEDGTIEGLSKEGFKQFRAAVKSVAGEAIGNMNPDDVGAMDTDFYMNQMMAFKTWMPELVQEYLGDLRWDDTQQAMRWGRFKAYLNDYRKDLNFTKDELEHGRLFYAYMSKVVAPNISKLILDVATFGLVPSIKKSRVNENRAKLMFMKWQLDHPNLRGKVTYDDFLEIKQGQIKAMVVQLRFLLGMMALAAFLGGAGDDGEPRYSKNWFTRTADKIVKKGGSELTFMWNPSEFLRLTRNPWPLTGLLTQLQKTVFNGFDESRDLVLGEDSNGDKTPALYFLTQWMYGGPQLTRFFEVFDVMEKSTYQIFNTSSQ